MDRAGSAVPGSASVYYRSTYWNDVPRVVRYISELATGDPDKWWTVDFQERFCAQPFEHALFVNCGNGWAERQFIDRGMVRRATAFDYSEELLAEARREAGERPIEYFQADVNAVELPLDHFDLCVNIGALHHVQFIERLARQMCAALTDDALLVAFDYIGPARNQYPARQWREIVRANQALPGELRRMPLKRPHLPTLLKDDPSEAIHADLVLDALGSYFTFEERHDVGGGIAYELFSHNPVWLAEPAPPDRDRHADAILALDRRLTDEGRIPPLFSYYLARPSKVALSDPGLRVHLRAEDEREAWAARHLLTYSWRDYLRVKANHVFWGAVVRVARLPGVRHARRALKRS